MLDLLFSVVYFESAFGKAVPYPNRSVISRNVQNTKISDMHNLLSQGHDMDYIARHYHMDLALIWALLLEEKTDQEKFKELGCGLRTWPALVLHTQINLLSLYSRSGPGDQWNFNECLPREIHVNDKQSVFHRGDERFGDDWPGRIPAQLVAHTLFYFTKPGDLVFDPMAGGGVVSDICLLFERKCQSFDLATRDNRPETQYHHWDSQHDDWHITGKADLIFFDPPYYIKQKKANREKANENTPSISSYSKERYEEVY